MKTTVFAVLFVPLVAPALGQEYLSAMPKEILTTECFSQVDRRTNLEPHRTKSAAASTWWQSGYVAGEGGDWIPFEDVPPMVRADSQYAEYLGIRSTLPGNRASAWARKHKQPDRARAHALAYAAKHSVAPNPAMLNEMSYTRINGIWHSPEHRARRAQRFVKIQASLRRYGKRLTSIKERLVNNTLVAQAIAELDNLSAADAVEAIDAVLGTGPPVCQRHAAMALARIDSIDSTLTLTRHAVFNELESVRQVAKTALASRTKDAFVPAVLNLLVTTRVEVMGNLPTVYELPFAVRPHVTARVLTETNQSIQSRRRVVRFDIRRSTGYLRPGAPTDSDGIIVDFLNGQPLGNAYRKLRSIREWARLGVIATENEAATDQLAFRKINQRAMSLLEAVSKERSDDPRTWWMWWQRHIDVEEADKPIVEVNEETKVKTVQRRLRLSIVHPSCFAGTTSVFTETGPKTIASVQIGDRVLAQDIETGELGFRVVQQTTVRPRHHTLIVSFDDEPVQCTGGHNFWRAGTGWVKARDLEVGDRIRTPTGTEAVTAVAKGEPVKTYNLVVEGFHTYFVGDSKLLVQDVLPITPTDNVLPGFSKFELGEDAPKSDRSE